MPFASDTPGKYHVYRRNVCDRKFDVNHAMICPRGGFPTLRHNQVQDLTADLLTEVCHDVEIEPQLQELTGTFLSSNRQHG